MGENIIYKLYDWYISRKLDPNKMPKHVAIIMDGNRRYAKLQGNKDVLKGHELGVDVFVRDILPEIERVLGEPVGGIDGVVDVLARDGERGDLYEPRVLGLGELDEVLDAVDVDPLYNIVLCEMLHARCHSMGLVSSNNRC